MEKRQVLRDHFGYDSFRPGQEGIMDALLSGRDVLAVMPTGAGKSLCYQVPAMCLPGLTLVISPLISLMQDQVESLRQAGVAAACLNSAMDEGAYRAALEDAYRGRCKLLYVAPERLALRAPAVAVTGFDRPNLFFEVDHPRSKKRALLSFLKEHEGESGILYCATRRQVESLCAYLQERDFSVTRYHAGLLPQERRENQDAFAYGCAQIMVATNAFGMGIDKSDVRFVIHYNMPKGERFGAGVIADVLRGAKTERVRSWRLDQLTTYGIMNGMSSKEIQKRTRQLVEQDCLRQSDGQYPTLFLGFRARGVLFGGERVTMHIPRPKEEAPAPSSAKRQSADAYPVDEELFKALRALRAKLANQRGVPPYMIFSDRTLREMCRLLPSCHRELLEVSGVGRQKLEWYGDLFLEAIGAHRRQYGDWSGPL